MQGKKFRWISLLLVLVMLFTACGSATAPNEEKSTETSSTAETPKTGTKKKVVLLCDVAGTQPYILDLIRGLEEAGEKYGADVKYVECADDAAYMDNARALIVEGVDLLIGGNWQAGEAIAAVAKEFPDKASYALIDSEVDQDNVKCISYFEQESAYLIGQLAAMVTKPEEKTFGQVGVTKGTSSWKWRYGYMEGVKSVKPDAKFIFNYVGSYSDPAKAKEYAIQQYEQGARYINAACAGGDSGVFEAAKEKGFYTSGQDIDLTTPDNPYILSGQLKDAGNTVAYVMEQYFTEGKWNTDNEVLGIKEGGVGAVHVTHESKNPPSEVLTPEILQKLKDSVKAMEEGKLNLRDIPDEASYQ